MLCRRYLCFGTKELVWECLEDVACTCSTTDRSFNLNSAMRSKNFFAAKSQITFLEGNPVNLWHELIEKYTVRELTLAKDKLPALAGLANSFQVSEPLLQVHS